MKNIGTIGAADDHVGGVGRVPVIDGDRAADEVVHGEAAALETKAIGIAILVEAVGGEEFFEIDVVDLIALGLVIRPVFSFSMGRQISSVRSFVTIEAEP